ncbi:MAG TPA: hypothetical protein VF134_03635 [Candidatus Dormibacteraeota bacterium]
MAALPDDRLVPLNEVAHENEVMILPDFPALLDDGREVWVTAVLERTAVVEPAPGEPKILVNRARCRVDPSILRYGPIAARDAARRGREAARRNRAARQQQPAA